MVTVKHLLKSKPSKATYSISPDVSVLDAMRMMYKHSIGCLIVLDHENIVGIITERDYARKLGQGLHASNDLRVRDVMTPNDHIFALDGGLTIDTALSESLKEIKSKVEH